MAIPIAPPESVTPIVEVALKEIRYAGAKKIGGVGYCFGAKYVVRHLKPSDLDGGFITHPSFVEEEEVVVKADEVTADEVTADEVKADEVTADEVKADEGEAMHGPLTIAAAGVYMIHTPNVHFEPTLADEVGTIIFSRLRTDARPKIFCSVWISHGKSISFRSGRGARWDRLSNRQCIR